MKNRLLGLCLLLALLVPTAQGLAAQSRHITLRIGDAFEVAGTSLACSTQVGKNVIKGQKLVACFKVNGSNLAAKSYVAALGANGRVVVGRVKADGSGVGAAVFNRKPAGVGSAT